jgi:hypothetical protein
MLDALNDSLWLPRAIYPGHESAELDLEVELAVPDGRGGLRPFRKLRLRGRPDYLSPVGLVIPGNVRDDPRAWTQLEALQAVTRRCRHSPAGAPPRRLPARTVRFSRVLRQARRMRLDGWRSCWKQHAGHGPLADRDALAVGQVGE